MRDETGDMNAQGEVWAFEHRRMRIGVRFALCTKICRQRQAHLLNITHDGDANAANYEDSMHSQRFSRSTHFYDPFLRS